MIRCPNCAGENIWEVNRTTDLYQVDPDSENGKLEYTGEVRTISDEICVVTDSQGHPELHCRDCGTEWFEQTVIEMVWQVGASGEGR
jgi:hypothetical protein